MNYTFQIPAKIIFTVEVEAETQADGLEKIKEAWYSGNSELYFDYSEATEYVDIDFSKTEVR